MRGERQRACAAVQRCLDAAGLSRALLLRPCGQGSGAFLVSLLTGFLLCLPPSVPGASPPQPITNPLLYSLNFILSPRPAVQQVPCPGAARGRGVGQGSDHGSRGGRAGPRTAPARMGGYPGRVLSPF